MTADSIFQKSIKNRGSTATSKPITRRIERGKLTLGPKGDQASAEEHLPTIRNKIEDGNSKITSKFQPTEAVLQVKEGAIQSLESQVKGEKIEAKRQVIN